MYKYEMDPTRTVGATEQQDNLLHMLRDILQQEVPQQLNVICLQLGPFTQHTLLDGHRHLEQHVVIMAVLWKQMQKKVLKTNGHPVAPSDKKLGWAS